MKRYICIVMFFAVLFAITACSNRQSEPSSGSQTEPTSTYSDTEPDEEKQPALETEEEAARFQQNDNETGKEENAEMRMKVQVGDSIFTAALENNAAVHALVEMMEKEPVVIRMSDYSGFEKVGALGKSLPTDNSRTTTEAGDIVLYQGNQIVMFYGSNAWSYTRLGRVEDLTGWEDALGSGDVTVTFSTANVQ